MSRTDRRAEQAHARLTERLARVREVGDLVAGAPGRLPDPLAERLAATLDHAGARLGHGAAHTVVALAGATGSGKSSVFNALVGSDVAAVGVRRPTTSAAQAGVFAATGEVDHEVSGLLGWLQVDRRHVVGGPGAPELDGLVLLDLPDHDSTAADHRAEVDRLVAVVDAFVWVVDPQKYADAALHDGYLRRFSSHAAVTIVVLNQVDLLPDDQRRAVVEDLGRLLADDGLGDVRVLTASARTGEGVEQLRRELAARVAERRALVARLDADVDRLSDDLAREVGDRPPAAVPDGARRRLGSAFAGAAGADAVADAVGHAHRRRAA
jgi:GTP-binding protein EngB required for normal cell division